MGEAKPGFRELSIQPSPFLFLFLIRTWEREEARGEGVERESEKHRSWACERETLIGLPHVPGLVIKPAIFWCMRWCSRQSSHPARANPLLLLITDTKLTSQTVFSARHSLPICLANRLWQQEATNQISRETPGTLPAWELILGWTTYLPGKHRRVSTSVFSHSIRRSPRAYIFSSLHSLTPSPLGTLQNASSSKELHLSCEGLNEFLSALCPWGKRS